MTGVETKRTFAASWLCGADSHKMALMELAPHLRRLLCQAGCACRCFLLSLLHIRRTAFGDIETVKQIAS
jgi:hypothetical protein